MESFNKSQQKGVYLLSYPLEVYVFKLPEYLLPVYGLILVLNCFYFQFPAFNMQPLEHETNAIVN